ncbi:MAG: hydrolase [Gammaproteobacteria bacterium]|nr:MAG: hydrolase [Gammaproteobacteria bacterium]
MESKARLILNAQDSLLVVVDIQQRLTAAMPTGVRERVIEQVKVLLTAAKVLTVPVVVTEQYPKGLGLTEPELVKELPEATTLIEKTSFSCMNIAEFCSEIDKTACKQIILTGMESHICILQTALDLQAQGHQVFVVEDAVSSRSKVNQYNSLQRLRHAGVIITNVESVIFEWLGDAKHPEFKTLAKLIV